VQNSVVDWVPDAPVVLETADIDLQLAVIVVGEMQVE
jgi:hypothetical protein